MRIDAAGAEGDGRGVRGEVRRPHPEQHHAASAEQLDVGVRLLRGVGVEQRGERGGLGEDVGVKGGLVHRASSSRISHCMPSCGAYSHSGRIRAAYTNS